MALLVRLLKILIHGRSLFDLFYRRVCIFKNVKSVVCLRFNHDDCVEEIIRGPAHKIQRGDLISNLSRLQSAFFD